MDLLVTVSTNRAIESVLAERNRQDLKHGTQLTLIPHESISLITEELGEAAQAANDWIWRGYDPAHYREELVHTAAMAVKAIEAHDTDMDRRAEEKRQYDAETARRWQSQARNKGSEYVR